MRGLAFLFLGATDRARLCDRYCTASLWFLPIYVYDLFFFFFSSRRRHTRSDRDWSSDVCSSDLPATGDGRWLPYGVAYLGLALAAALLLHRLVEAPGRRVLCRVLAPPERIGSGQIGRAHV